MLLDVDEDILMMDKVRYVRTKQREGLIRARMLGAELAKGEVVMVYVLYSTRNQTIDVWLCITVTLYLCICMYVLVCIHLFYVYIYAAW